MNLSNSYSPENVDIQPVGCTKATTTPSWTKTSVLEASFPKRIQGSVGA